MRAVRPGMGGKPLCWSSAESLAWSSVVCTPGGAGGRYNYFVATVAERSLERENVSWKLHGQPCRRQAS